MLHHFLQDLLSDIQMCGLGILLCHVKGNMQILDAGLQVQIGAQPVEQSTIGDAARCYILTTCAVFQLTESLFGLQQGARAFIMHVPQVLSTCTTDCISSPSNEPFPAYVRHLHTKSRGPNVQSIGETLALSCDDLQL